MTALDTPTPLPARRVVGGRYRLDHPLGGGAMGTVWRGHDTRLGRDVAVKEVVLPPGLPEAERWAARERAFREARIAARLRHPSALEVYDVVEADGRPWLVMELVEARSLAEVVRDDGPLTPVELARVGLALLGALGAAHAVGVLHRDVKPGNVLLTADGRVVLSDFGIATSASDVRITSTGMLLGSPAYMAPERARGQAPGPASDLWSLGATLYAAAEGRPPFDGIDPLSTLTQVVSEPAEPPRAAGPLGATLLGLLEKDPDRRLGAARAREDLSAVLEGRDPAGGPVADPAGGPAPARRGAPAQRAALRSARPTGPARPDPPAPRRGSGAAGGSRPGRAGTAGTAGAAGTARWRLRGQRALVALALVAAAAAGFASQREDVAAPAPAVASATEAEAGTAAAP